MDQTFHNPSSFYALLVLIFCDLSFLLTGFSDHIHLISHRSIIPHKICLDLLKRNFDHAEQYDPKYNSATVLCNHCLFLLTTTILVYVAASDPLCFFSSFFSHFFMVTLLPPLSILAYSISSFLIGSGSFHFVLSVLGTLKTIVLITLKL